MSCILLVSIGIGGTSAASVAQDSQIAVKLEEIELLRKSSGIERAEWAKRYKSEEALQEPEVCYDPGCLDACKLFQTSKIGLTNIVSHKK